jgi:hypothetical protein
MPLPSSFWVDEMASVFVTHHGAGDPSLRVAPQVADSLYYLLPSAVERILGPSEVSFRLTSVAAMLCALLAIGKIATSLIHPRAGWMAAFACITVRDFNFQAADARPCALGTLVLSCGILALIQWLDSGRTRDAILFAVVGAALWWTHLVFWPFYTVFVLYGVVRVRREVLHVSGLQIAGVAAIVLAGALPAAFRAMALLQNAAAHVIAPQPSLGDLSSQLRLGILTGAFTVFALLNRCFRWTPEAGTVDRSSMVLVLAWWLVDPLTLFLFSKATANSLFVGRYMVLAIPGAALVACAMVRVLIPARLWDPAAACLGCAVLLFGGHWNHIWPQHRDSDWRTASQQLRAWSASDNVPVICPSPFVEARSPEWRPDYPTAGFLYAHLSVYPIPGRIYPFPFEWSRAAAEFAHRLTTGTLLQAGRFAIYGGDRNVRFWCNWFAAQPEFTAWTSKTLGHFGDVEVVAFNKTTEPGPAPSSK